MRVTIVFFFPLMPAPRRCPRRRTRWLLCGLASMILPMLITRWTREMGMVAMPFVSGGRALASLSLNLSEQQ